MEKKQKPAGVPAEMPPEKVKWLGELKTKIRARLAEKMAEQPSTPIQVQPENAGPQGKLRVLPDPPTIAKFEDGILKISSPDPRIVLLDFTLPENEHLYEAWVKYGRSHRRGPGDQAMMAVEQILTNEGLI